MKHPRRSRAIGAVVLKKWSEAAAIKATMKRFERIEHTLIEIGGMWGEEDEYIVREVDELRALISEKAEEMMEGHAGLIEQRRLDAERGA